MNKFLAVLTLVLIIGIGIFAYKHARNASDTSPAATSPTSEPAASSIETYTNDKYKFAFDYPSTYGTSTVSFSGKDASDPADPAARFDGTLSPVGLTVEVDMKPANFGSAYLNDQFKLEQKERANAGFVLSTTTLMVNGNKVFAIEGVGHGQTEEEILLTNGAYLYSIGYSIPTGTQNNVVQKVLDTFRFLK